MATASKASKKIQSVWFFLGIQKNPSLHETQNQETPEDWHQISRISGLPRIGNALKAQLWGHWSFESPVVVPFYHDFWYIYIPWDMFKSSSNPP